MTKPKLLIVEDDDGLCSQYRWAFPGCDVLITHARPEAVAVARRDSPPVAIMDLGLPPDPDGVSEGFATLSEVLRIAPQTKVIVVTGNGERKNALRAIASGAYDFCEKPVEIEVLRTIIERGLNLHRLEDENRRLAASPARSPIERIVTDAPWADSNGRRNTLREEVAMSARKRRSDRSGRAPLVSPGRPPIAGRDERRRFWAAVAAGMASEDAAAEAGVSQAVGTRWFRKAGGMPPSMFRKSANPLSERYLSFAEREEIALLRAQDYAMREIARRLGRAASTISRELRRNAATRSGGLEYRATTAQWHAERAARRPKPAKLARNAALRTYVEERLAGGVIAPGGAPVPGPAVAWKGRRHGPRKDRRWANAWSPEQIARRLPVDFPDDETMRISHEAIYQALFVQGRGALRRELTACLRSGRALRTPRARTRGRGKTFISPEIMISKRPAEAADRAVPGHWEGDLIVGLGSSAIGTLVERTTRFTLLLHLPRMPGHGHEARVKNGPALAGHGAEAVRDAIARTIITLPEELRRSLTWDQGAEMAQHAALKVDAGVQVYFCEPHSPWQRGTNENTNGLLRQYFPKGTDLSTHSAGDIAAVAATLNARPRKTLAWKTPAEAFKQLLRSDNKPRVATTT